MKTLPLTDIERGRAIELGFIPPEEAVTLRASLKEAAEQRDGAVRELTKVGAERDAARAEVESGVSSNALLEEARDLLCSHADARAENAEADAARWRKIAFTDYDAMRLASREVLMLWRSLANSPESTVLKVQHEAALSRLELALAGIPSIGVPVKVLLSESLDKTTTRVAELEDRLKAVRIASGQPLDDSLTEAQWVAIYEEKRERGAAGFKRVLEERNDFRKALAQRTAELEQMTAERDSQITLVNETSDELRARLVSHWETTRKLEDMTTLAEARFDCHGGPGTTAPACRACVSCLTNALEAVDGELRNIVAAARKCLHHVEPAIGVARTRVEDTNLKALADGALIGVDALHDAIIGGRDRRVAAESTKVEQLEAQLRDLREGVCRAIGDPLLDELNEEIIARVWALSGSLGKVQGELDTALHFLRKAIALGFTGLNPCDSCGGTGNARDPAEPCSSCGGFGDKLPKGRKLAIMYSEPQTIICDTEGHGIAMTYGNTRAEREANAKYLVACANVELPKAAPK